MTKLYKMHEKTPHNTSPDRKKEALTGALGCFAAYLVPYILIRGLLEALLAALADRGPLELRLFLSSGEGLFRILVLTAAMAGGLLAVRRQGRECLRAFGEGGGRPERRDPAVLVLFTAAAVSGSLGLNGLLSRFMTGEGTGAGSSFLPALAFYCLFSPLAEEVLFRGILQVRLRRAFPASLSIGIAALLFSLYHADLVQGFYALAMGCLFGAAYEVFADIRLPWLLHGLSNLLPLALQAAGLLPLAAGPVWMTAFLSVFVLSGALLALRARTYGQNP